jgi:dTMP kinase
VRPRPHRWVAVGGFHGEDPVVLIALEGIDGAGKSTTAPALCERLRQHFGTDVELWRKSDPLPAPGAAGRKARELYDLIWHHPDGEPDRDGCGTRYHLYLHAAWYGLVQRYRLGPLRARAGALAVADGWYYRSVVKGVLRDGLPTSWCLSLFEHAGPPDVVVLLDVDPDVAWQRRQGRFTASELGRWDGYAGDPYKAYYAYQSRIGLTLRDFAVRLNWTVVTPQASWTSDQVVHHVYEQIAARIEQQGTRGCS